MIAAACSASSPDSPPVSNNTNAIQDKRTPQTTFTPPLGKSDPYEVCIPSTNVAESADVIKKIVTSNSAMKLNIAPSGNSLNIANNCVSGGRLRIVSAC